MNEDRHRGRSDGEQDELTRLLRRADPAAGDPGLDPAEVALVRQAITRAADGVSPRGRWIGGRQHWMTPAAAAAAITVVALGAWLITGGSVTEEREVTDAGLAATDATPAPIDPGNSTSPELAPATTAPVAEAAPEAPVDAATAATVEVDAVNANTPVAAVEAPSPPDKQARTVQFTAPRGTRIIWTLDPNFETPIAEQEPRQEQSR